MAQPGKVPTITAIEARKLFELLAMMMVGACVWLVCLQLGLFDALAHFFRVHGLIDVASLSGCMALGAIAAVVHTSLQLRRAVAARIEAEETAERNARQDPLTGLGNRRHFNEQLAEKLAARRGDETFAILLIDLDRFKPVNDVHGHAAGNAVLCEVAKRLVEVAPPEAVVARLGGDEFVALVSGLDDETQLGLLAARMIEAVRRRIPWRQGYVEVDATIGVSLVPPEGCDPDELVHAADVAMYQGKREGRGVWRFFREEMSVAVKARAQLESDLRAAISQGAIVPHYQPIVSLPDKRLVGFEVLARWTHAKLGAMDTQNFITVAEECGMISELFVRLLRVACLEALRWPGHLRLAVNVSPRQLQDGHLPELVLAVLTQTRFPAERLEIEITETALINDIDAARVALTSLQNLGVQIALDDFGTGYSTLYHLSELRFDKLKIDRSYVTDLKPGSERAKLVDAILQLGSSLSVQTTAEGIENDENLDWLAQQGCSYGQGYLFGRATGKDGAEAYIEKDRLAHAPIPIQEARRLGFGGRW